MTDDCWHKTACILCASNCGIEVKLDGRSFQRIRGNKAHVASKGYTCEKALRLDHYQNGPHRLTTPLRRTATGEYEPVDWDTAIAEVAAGLAGVRDQFGGESIFFYNSGQGNHLAGLYSGALMAALGVRYKSNPLAQEKTGELFVEFELYGAKTGGDFERSKVAVFVGKNPWLSHGIPEARRTLKALAADPDRALVVLDVRRTETADMADYFLQVRPGTDAFCLAAMLGTLVQEDLVDRRFLEDHCVDTGDVLSVLADVPVSDFAQRCGVDEGLLRTVARRLGTARSVAVFEDLGIEQAPHSTLSSYLEKLLWILVGSFAKPGGMHPTSMFGLPALIGLGAPSHTPVTGAENIAGLVPCNVIADEILTDHPDRFRAMVVESGNPANSLADSRRFREAMAALEFSVVIDVAFTETARLADYVLPASSQFEKPECVFFNFEFPANVFYLRKPVLNTLPGTLPEPEIHTRLLRALGAYTDDDLTPLREAAARGRQEFASAYFGLMAQRPEFAGIFAAVLYETLGLTLPVGLSAAAPLWVNTLMSAQLYPDAVRSAGHQGEGAALGDALFDAILAGDDGVVFTDHRYEDAYQLIMHGDNRIHVGILQLTARLAALGDAPASYTTEEFPLVLSAGERRSFTANTIYRDPAWRKRDPNGALRVSTHDAEALGLDDGGRARVVTKRGQVETFVEVSDTLQPGHISLPNGLGLDHPGPDGQSVVTGVAANELTSTDLRDDIAGTPWHKHVPARVEALAVSDGN